MKKNQERQISIVKYNPSNRDSEGFYSLKEWTSYSDIGKKFNGVSLTKKEYLRIEDNYIKAIFFVLNALNFQYIKISHLLKMANYKDFEKHNDRSLYSYFENLNSELIITESSDISNLIKLRLREYIVELELLIDGDENNQIYFGFDYYMYLKTNKDISPALENIVALGLFVY